MANVWLNSTEYDTVKRQVIKTLETLGWIDGHCLSTAVANKPFNSIVGIKSASTYLTQYDANNWALKGEFFCCGQDVLTTYSGIINKSLSESDISLAVSGFVGMIEARIKETKMVSLYQKRLGNA
jgi:hypothetical protein